MTSFIIVLCVGCIPVARAITLSRAAGARGFVGFMVWSLECISRETWILAGGWREFDHGRKARRALWMSEQVR